MVMAITKAFAPAMGINWALIKAQKQKQNQP